MKNFFSIKPKTMVSLLLIEREIDQKIDALVKASDGVISPDWGPSFEKLVNDCIGIPEGDYDHEDNPDGFSRDFIGWKFFECPADEDSIKKYLSWLTKVFHDHFREYPDQKIYTRKQEYALVEVLQAQHKWNMLIFGIASNGLLLLWGDEIDLLSIVFSELDKSYSSRAESGFEDYIQKGTVKECLAYVEYIRGLPS